MAKELDLAIRRGETFKLSVRWETEPWLYAAIASINRAAPVRIVSASHAIPDGWQVAVVDAQGMTALNAANNPAKNKDMRRATVISPTEIEFNEISSAAFTAHKPNTGYLAWRTPHALTGYRARMQIKDRVGGVAFFTFTDDLLGGIEIDEGKKVIEVTMTAAQAEAAASAGGVYDLEMVSPGGVVTALLVGTVSFGDEVTTIT